MHNLSSSLLPSLVLAICEASPANCVSMQTIGMKTILLNDCVPGAFRATLIHGEHIALESNDVAFEKSF